MGHRIADAVPDLILEGYQRWRRQYLGRLASLDAIDDKTGDVDFSVRVIRIAFAISAEQCRAGSGNLEQSLDHSRLLQIAHQQVAIGVDVGSDMVGDLSCIVAQTYPTIERDRAEPDRTAIRSFFKDQPEADVMSLVGAPAIRFFEGQLLLLPFVIKRADRRIVIRPVKHHAADDLDTVRNVIGRQETSPPRAWREAHLP